MNRNLLLAMICLLIINGAHAQRNKELILTTYFQYERYPCVNTTFNGTLKEQLTMKGMIPGISLGYHHYLSRRFFVGGGIGLGRVIFTNIESVSPLVSSRARPIDYHPSPAAVLFSSDKYWYNNLNLELGGGFDCSNWKHATFTTGITAETRFSFSQGYNIPGVAVYHTREHRFFGLSVIPYAMIRKRFGKLLLGPGLRVPVFTLWKQDTRFHEDPSDSRNKWFNSVSVSFSATYRLQ